MCRAHSHLEGADSAVEPTAEQIAAFASTHLAVSSVVALLNVAVRPASAAPPDHTAMAATSAAPARLIAPKCVSMRITRVVTDAAAIVGMLPPAPARPLESGLPIAPHSAVRALSAPMSTQQLVASSVWRAASPPTPFRARPAYGLAAQQSMAPTSCSAPLSYGGKVTRCISRALGLFEIDNLVLLFAWHSDLDHEVLRTGVQVGMRIAAYNIHIAVLDASTLAPAVRQWLVGSDGDLVAPVPIQVCVACSYSTLVFPSKPPPRVSADRDANDDFDPLMDRLLDMVLSPLRSKFLVPLSELLDLAGWVLSIARALGPPLLTLAVAEQLASSLGAAHRTLVRSIGLLSNPPVAIATTRPRRQWQNEFYEHPRHCATVSLTPVSLQTWSVLSLVQCRAAAAHDIMKRKVLIGWLDVSPAGSLVFQDASDTVPVLPINGHVCPTAIGHLVWILKPRIQAGGLLLDGMHLSERGTLRLLTGQQQPISSSLSWLVVHVTEFITSDTDADMIIVHGRGNPTDPPLLNDSLAAPPHMSLHLDVEMVHWCPLLRLEARSVPIAIAPCLQMHGLYLIGMTETLGAATANPQRGRLANISTVVPLHCVPADPDWATRFPDRLVAPPLPRPAKSNDGLVPIADILDGVPQGDAMVNTAGTITRIVFRGPGRSSSHIIHLRCAVDDVNEVRLYVLDGPQSPLPFPLATGDPQWLDALVGLRLVVWSGHVAVAQSSGPVLMAGERTRVELVDASSLNAGIKWGGTIPMPSPPLESAITGLVTPAMALRHAARHFALLLPPPALSGGGATPAPCTQRPPLLPSRSLATLPPRSAAFAIVRILEIAVVVAELECGACRQIVALAKCGCINGSRNNQSSWKLHARATVVVMDASDRGGRVDARIPDASAWIAELFNVIQERRLRSALAASGSRRLATTGDKAEVSLSSHLQTRWGVAVRRLHDIGPQPIEIVGPPVALRGPTALAQAGWQLVGELLTME
ncbi:hypothetical protein BC828DRAFT_377753 [Blastocladiella britannica]|nr:hypothetical protein BC828DRAFT_377753 [Blastocladiella britannica]